MTSSLTTKAWVAVLLLVSASAQAASAPDFNETCDDVLKLEDGIKQAGDKAWTVAQQKLSYCSAAKDSKSAASSNGLLWKVWAGVAGVCTTACIASFTGAGAGLAPVCTYSNIGAGVTDMVVTKNFQSGLTSIGSGLIAQKFLKNGVTKVDGKAKQTGKNWAACLSAGIAATSVFTKKNAASQATDAMNGNLASAATLGPVTSVMGPTTTALAPGQNNMTTNSVTNGTTRVTGGAGLTDDDKNKKIAAACDGAASSGDTTKVTSCALATDKNLPDWVASNPFNNELKNATGQDLGGFVKGSGDNPSNAVGMASGLTGDAAGKFGQLLAATEKAVGDQSPAESTYAGGGGGGNPGGHEEPAVAPDFAGALAKMMGKGKDDEKGDPQNLKFSGKPGIPSWLRGPASEDDKNFSLFDRVTYRYYFVGRRIIYDEEPTPSAKR